MGDAKARAIFLLGLAGSCFAAFMLLALYLIFAKIETNLRAMHSTLASQPSPSLLPATEVTIA